MGTNMTNKAATLVDTDPDGDGGGGGDDDSPPGVDGDEPGIGLPDGDPVNVTLTVNFWPWLQWIVQMK
ncbi:hypothetical protein KY290_030773 [Solanum tuberosum]|uniref:Uncharacterized protein n=1 Tax=Solanum tuberosum TaxID=4113 RepID=A0ABQ7U783_SOLTU|nr:hypothetical protein KY289_030009 [Solanum tuberosum]KAH0654955.1 hypothetical protein KY285_029837 [Solanum tuberosum]KAH0742780.1 hypothetical protein KY290_030773 [Solanum tuberosum]